MQVQELRGGYRVVSSRRPAHFPPRALPRDHWFLFSEAMASEPPSPMVSTAEEGRSSWSHAPVLSGTESGAGLLVSSYRWSSAPAHLDGSDPCGLFDMCFGEEQGGREGSKRNSFRSRCRLAFDRSAAMRAPIRFTDRVSAACSRYVPVNGGSVGDPFAISRQLTAHNRPNLLGESDVSFAKTSGLIDTRADLDRWC